MKIYLFGPLREKYGEWINIELESPTTVSDLIKQIGKKLKLSQRQEASLKVATKEKYLKKSDTLEDDEVLVIPPVGGG